MHVYQLIYLSKAARQLSMKEALSIVDTAATKNEEAGITGLLCFGGGYFMQVLEGGHAEVNHTFRRIVGDRRHHEVCLVDFSLVRTRTFGDWSMRLINLDAPDNPRPELRPKILVDDDTHPFFTTDPRAAYALMHQFKEK